MFDFDFLEVRDSFVEILICECNFLSKSYRIRQTLKVFKDRGWTGWRFELTTRLRKLARGGVGTGHWGFGESEVR